MQVFSALQFTGGMNEWIYPGLLQENFAASLTNADVSNGKIAPVKKPQLLEYDTPEAYGHYGNRDRSVAKLYDRIYWSNNTAVEEPYYGGTEGLGILYPDYSKKNVIGYILFDPDAHEGGFEGVYKYCICYVNQNGWEGAPGSPDNYEVEITLNEPSYVYVNLTAPPPSVKYAKIYRTIDHGADFYCVGEVNFYDDTSVFYGIYTFIDSTPDNILQFNNPLTSAENYPPPAGGKYLCENNGVFYLAVGSSLYYSVHGNPHAWPRTQFIALENTITGIVPEFQGVLVFTESSVYRITGAENPSAIMQNFIPGTHGCIDNHSIAVINNAPIWLSSDGICLWDGSEINVVSYRIMKTAGLCVKYAVALNDCYYLFTDIGCIVYDMKNGGVFYKLDFTCDYAWADGNDIYLYSGGGVFKYGKGNNLTAEYVSPNIGGSESTIKVFKEMLLNCDGTSSVDISVDGKEVAAVNLKKGRQRVKLPSNAVGQYLTLKIRSSNNINEVTVTYDNS